MALTCLQIIQTVCSRIGLTQPSAAVTSTDLQINQLLALSNQAATDLVKRYDWESLQTEATFTTVATQSQGSVETLAPGLKYILNNTIWNRTNRLPIVGSQSPQDWQQMVAMQLTSPYSQYRVQGGNLLFYPIPTAGQTCAFEYMSNNWVLKSTTGTSSYWTNDADTPLLSDDLIILGTTWRWKAAKGLDYAEDFATYERDLMEAMSTNASKPILRMAGTLYSIEPVVVVPSGSWMS